MEAIINGTIVTPHAVIQNGIILMNNGKIVNIYPSEQFIFFDHDFIQFINQEERATDELIPCIDAKGSYILPGFIDTHSDKIETLVQPRPTSTMDYEFAMIQLDRELINQGITTMYHSISLHSSDAFGVSSLRHKDNVLKFADLVNDAHFRNHLIHHRFHLRLEIDNLEGFEVAQKLINDKKVHQVSFMDHTPGQGQYRNLEIYQKTMKGYSGNMIDKVGLEGVLELHKNKEMLSVDQLQELATLCAQNQITVASHDDDSIEKLKLNQKLGVKISEFPITMEVARAAKELGFYTVLGAPNILLGGSHSGNLNAAEAIMANCVDILCSDYYPAAMLEAVFYMVNRHNIPLYEMVNKVSLNPAKALKIDGNYGSITPGKKADLLFVDLLNDHPVINKVLINGIVTACLDYHR